MEVGPIGATYSGSMAMTESRKAELTEKVHNHERLSRQDGEDLYDSDDLAWLGVVWPTTCAQRRTATPSSSTSTGTST